MTTDGIMFLQNSAIKTALWADQHGSLTEKGLRSVEMFGNTMVATVFTLERMFMDTRMGVPHIIGGRVFWDVRSMKPYLKLKYGDEQCHHPFVNHHFDNAHTQWRNAFAMAGGTNGDSHFLNSLLSYNIATKKAVQNICG